jgi:predicted nucleic acid-binding protein
VSAFFLDSSAVAKRYLAETGTAWIIALTDPVARHTIFLAEFTYVEVAAALAARHRAPGGITRQERDTAVTLLLRHCQTEYRLNVVDRRVLDRAVRLTQRHRLRGYDAVQLATALATSESLLAAGFPALTFVAADADLILATRAEGLPADDPNLHP